MTPKILAFLVLIIVGITSLAFPLDITSVSPRQNAINVDVTSKIMIGFDQRLDIFSMNEGNIIVSGDVTGRYRGTFTYDKLTSTVIFQSDYPFRPNEKITVTVSNRLSTHANTCMAQGKTWSFTATAKGGKGAFPYYTDLKTGMWPQSVILQDFNGDLYPDILIANQRTQSLSLYLNNESHNFLTRREFNVGKMVVDVTTADFDNDFDNDVALCVDTSEVYVLTNYHKGYFGQKQVYSVGNHPWEITNGDLNSDGFADLQVVNNASDNFSVLSNRTDGMFFPKQDYDINRDPATLFYGDVDNDWDMDLAIANQHDGTISIFYNKGDGIFDSRIDYNVGGYPTSLKMADLNTDGYLDIIIAAAGTDYLFVLKNNGMGKFPNKEIYSTNSWPRDLAVADFDNDNDMDIIVINYMSNDLLIFSNNGIGDFAQSNVYYLGESPRAISAADLDNDGAIDIVVTLEADNQALIYWNEK